MKKKIALECKRLSTRLQKQARKITKKQALCDIFITMPSKMLLFISKKKKQPGGKNEATSFHKQTINFLFKSPHPVREEKK
jgi:hypothetical protein